MFVNYSFFTLCLLHMSKCLNLTRHYSNLIKLTKYKMFDYLLERFNRVVFLNRNLHTSY